MAEFRGLRDIADIRTGKKRNLIGSMVASDGQVVTDRKGIADVFADVYKDLYKSKGMRDDGKHPECEDRPLQEESH